jgi:hypothetical protein
MSTASASAAAVRKASTELGVPRFSNVSLYRGKSVRFSNMFNAMPSAELPTRFIHPAAAFGPSPTNSATITSGSDSIAGAHSPTASRAGVPSGLRRSPTTFAIPSKTCSHGLVETSRSTIVVGLSPARSSASRIAASLTESETLGSVAIPSSSRASFSAAFCKRTRTALTHCFAAPP